MPSEGGATIECARLAAVGRDAGKSACLFPDVGATGDHTRLPSAAGARSPLTEKTLEEVFVSLMTEEPPENVPFRRWSTLWSPFGLGAARERAGLSSYGKDAGESDCLTLTVDSFLMLGHFSLQNLSFSLQT